MYIFSEISKQNQKKILLLLYLYTYILKYSEIGCINKALRCCIQFSTKHCKQHTISSVNGISASSKLRIRLHHT